LTRLPRVAAKLRRARDGADPLRTAIYGDSLALADSERGGRDAWVALLFDPNATVAAYYLGSAFPYAPLASDVINRAVGGTTIHLAAAHVAIDQNGACPALDDPVDLAIICAGENGGGRNAEIHELIVRRLREVGTDVILVASNTRVGDRTHGEDRARAYRAIADHYQCAFADVNLAYRLALAKGDASDPEGKTEGDLFLDAVHPTPEGYRLYAATILDVLRDAVQREASPYVRPRASLFPHPGIPAELDDGWRDLIRVRFDLEIIGTNVKRQVGAANTVKDPRSGRASYGEFVLPADEASGSGLRFDIERAVAVDLIVAGGTSSVIVTSEREALKKYVSYSVREYRLSVVELLLPEDLGVRGDGGTTMLELRWASGDPVRVLGIVLYG